MGLDKKEIEPVHDKLIKAQLNTLHHSIEAISHYCHSRQSCDKCLIKSWCKEQRKKCPEEWRSKTWPEIDIPAVDQDKSN